MSWKNGATLLALAALWGASFLFMRIAAPELGPFVTAECRVALAAAALLLYAKLAGHRFDFRRRWKAYLIVGTLNAAAPFALITAAEMRIPASLASILNATTPLFTALVGWIWLKQPFGMRSLWSTVIGVTGVAILLGWTPDSLAAASVLSSAALSLIAAVLYGIAGHYASRAFPGVRPLELAIGQQLGAAIVLIPFSLASLPHKLPSLQAVLAITGLALFSTSIAYLLYFQLLRSVGAVKTLSVTFLVPLFGVLWGVLLLGETIRLNMLIGMLVIFSSIGLMIARKQPAPAQKKNG